MICSQSLCVGDSREGGNADMQKGKARQPAVAGSFYPGSEKALREAVTTMLQKAQPVPLDGKVIGLIAPHAGYIYSGQIAAYAYRAVQGQKFDAVIVISPSHHVYFAGSSIYREGPYMTPLGTVETADDIADAIAKGDKSVSTRTDAHAQEHALEVQVPFLQVAIPGLRLVPIVMGDQSLETCEHLADAIVTAVRGKHVLLVASSDLSHFHTYAEAQALDRVVADRISRYDPEGLARDLDLRKCEACGGGPIVTVMLAARQLGASKAVVLKQANSGDVTGDRSNVVGYLAAALTAPAKAGGDPAPKLEDSKSQAGSVGIDLGLRREDKVQLLKIARESIEAAVLGKPVPVFRADSPLLNEKMGAFVTITEGGELRGCIGHIVGTQALYRTVSDMAVAAAMEDPRFPALAPAELGRIAVEISVLTPLKRISSPDEIVVGRDGIYLEKGYYRGLLLPQVATEYDWDRYQFLDHTCLKAGLEPGSWREGANIQTFSAQVFNEADVLGRASSK
jgi:AmmeMemoRadiSam system protein B/AmmeMemoRadiSam system protein A